MDPSGSSESTSAEIQRSEFISNHTSFIFQRVKSNCNTQTLLALSPLPVASINKPNSSSVRMGSHSMPIKKCSGTAMGDMLNTLPLVMSIWLVAKVVIYNIVEAGPFAGLLPCAG